MASFGTLAYSKARSLRPNNQRITVYAAAATKPTCRPEMESTWLTPARA